MERGGDRRSEQAKSKGPHGPIERKPVTSAGRPAGLVGCSARTVKRARTIRKKGSPEILDALRNRKMTINQAEKALAKKLGRQSRVKKKCPRIEHRREELGALNRQNQNRNLAELKSLGPTSSPTRGAECHVMPCMIDSSSSDF
jgi:hypothetical protein